MKIPAVKYILMFIIFALVQGLILKNVVLFDAAFCFLYILFILMLPIELMTIPALIIGFVIGLTIDSFYDTGGIHTSAILLISFVRERWLNMIVPQGGYEKGVSPTLMVGGLQWFAGYAFPLILLHHFALFFIEAGGFSLFLFTIKKVFLSSIFTFIVCTLVLFTFMKKQ